LLSEGLADPERVAHDGTKIRAAASRSSFQREERRTESKKLAEEHLPALKGPIQNPLAPRARQLKNLASLDNRFFSPYTYEPVGVSSWWAASLGGDPPAPVVGVRRRKPMRRIAFVLAAVFLAISAGTVQAQESGPASPKSIPAASRSQSDCTGFIAKPSVPHDLYVVGGADNDFHSIVRQFVDGESVYISHREGHDVAVGTEYSVVRPASDLFLTMHYSGERGGIRSVGQPYEDVARVRVTHVSPEGVVAKVTFSCSAVEPGDTLVPFQPRAIPEYTVSNPLDPFIPLESSKQHGRIVANHNNIGYVGDERVVYLNIGENEGARPGQRFRIYKQLAGRTSLLVFHEHTPPETVGEAVVLSVQAKSSVAMVISSSREIAAGDFVEAE